MEKENKKYGKESIIHLWNSDWYFNEEEIRKVAIHFQIENDIVNQAMWANQMYEDGIGMVHNDKINKKISEKQIIAHQMRSKEEQIQIWEKQKESRRITESKKTEAEKQIQYTKVSESLKKTLSKKDPSYFKDKTDLMHARLASMQQEEKDEVNEKRSKSSLGVPRPQKPAKCMHCAYESTQNVISRLHNDNCELVLTPDKLEERNKRKAIQAEKNRLASTGRGKPHTDCSHVTTAVLRAALVV